MPDTPASTVRAKRVSALFRLLLTLSAFLFVSGVLAARLFPDTLGTSPGFGVAKMACLCLAAAAAGLAVAGHWSGPRILTAAFACYLCLAIAFFAFWTGSNKFKTIVYVLLQRIPQGRARLGAPPPAPFMQFEPRMGYDLVSSGRRVHTIALYSVVQTTDKDRCRVTPAPSYPKGFVFVTGRSFTFGWGVEDRDTFPYILGEAYWPDYKIKNRSMGTWGTVHSYMAVSDLLESGRRPKAVIYCMIPHHLKRNYLSSKWLRNIGVSENLPETLKTNPEAARGHPHFELEEGKLVYKGIVGLESAVDEKESSFKTKATDLTTAFINGMNEKCREAGVPFIIVRLPTRIRARAPSLKFDPRVLEAIQRNNIPSLDLDGLQLVDSPDNCHPGPKDHQTLAKAIANSFLGHVIGGDSADAPTPTGSPAKGSSDGAP